MQRRNILPPNKRKANIRKKIKRQKETEKRRLKKKILSLINRKNKGMEITLLMNRYKSRYGDKSISGKG